MSIYWHDHSFITKRPWQAVAWFVIFSFVGMPSYGAIAGDAALDSYQLLEQRVVSMKTDVVRRIQAGESIQAPTIDGFKDAILALAAHPKARENNVRRFANDLFGYMRHANYSDEQELHVIQALLLSPNSDLRLFAQGKERVRALHQFPLSLQLEKFDGKPLRTEELIGKVVLVYVWATSCSSCVKAMPRLVEYHNKYRDDGFKVVTLCLLPDGINDKHRAASVLENTGAEVCENTFLAGADYKQFAEQFAITGVPVRWILGRDGRLFSSNLDGASLEAGIRKALTLGRDKGVN